MKCTSIMCDEEATMTLDLIVPLNNDESFSNSVPYCDKDIGWFYRSFSRSSYRVNVKGITVLLDLDAEFAI